MKTTAAFAASLSLANAVTLPELFRRAGTCEVLSGVTTTFYGFPDNSPPSAQTAYNCLGRGNIAGGTGTYADPVTFATAPGEYNQCEIIYSAYLKKYLIFQDTCEQCIEDNQSGKKHNDIWTGSSTSSGGQTQINCEDSLTPDSSDFVRNPPQSLDVDTTALFSNGQCQTSHTFNSNKGSCAGGSGTTGGVTSAPAPSATSSAPATSSTAASGGSGSTGTCSWAGHCAGATCSSDNDCSDALTCNSGKCGSS